MSFNIFISIIRLLKWIYVKFEQITDILLRYEIDLLQNPITYTFLLRFNSGTYGSYIYNQILKLFLRNLRMGVNIHYRNWRTYGTLPKLRLPCWLVPFGMSRPSTNRDATRFLVLLWCMQSLAIADLLHLQEKKRKRGQPYGPMCSRCRMSSWWILSSHMPGEEEAGYSRYEHIKQYLLFPIYCT